MSEPGARKKPAGPVRALAGWAWWVGLASALAALRPSDAFQSALLLVLALILGGLGIRLGRVSADLVRGPLGSAVALVSGAVAGASWGRMNLGGWSWEVLAGVVVLAFLSLAARGLLRARFRSRKVGAAGTLAAAITALGLLTGAALVLPDPSRHLVTLALGLALTVGLTAYWSGRFWGQLVLSLSTVCLVLFLLELTGTMILGLEKEAAGPGPQTAVTRPAPGEAGWRRARLERGRAEREAHWNQRCYQGRTININRYGFRGPDFSLEKPEAVYRVLVTGGSVAFGTPGKGDGFTLQGLLEKRLNQTFQLAGVDRKAQVYNLGLPALTSATELSILINLLDTRPDLVIMFTGWNDLTFAHEPGYYSEGQIGLLVPGCGGPGGRAGSGVDQTGFGARNTATIPRAARQLLLLIHELVSDSSRGYRWLTGLGRKSPAPAPTGQTAGASPSGAAPEKPGPGDAGAKAIGADKGVEKFLANVERARLLSEAQGAWFLLAVQPFRHCGPQALAEDQGARMGAIRESYLTLLARLRAQDKIKWVDTTRVSDLMEAMGSFYDSCHFDTEGYGLATEQVWQSLVAHGLVRPLARAGLALFPLEPAAGTGQGGPAAGPWALTLGSGSEATYRIGPGADLVFSLPPGISDAPGGKAFLSTALGAPPWVEAAQEVVIPYRVDLVRADGGSRILAQGEYRVGPDRAKEWLDIRAGVDPSELKDSRVRLRAEDKDKTYRTLHWRQPRLLILGPGESG